jgi:hypothetical protein
MDIGALLALGCFRCTGQVGAICPGLTVAEDSQS